MNPNFVAAPEDRYDRREGSGVSAEVVVSAARSILGGREPQHVECLSGGYSNANYLVQCDTDRLVFRFFLGGEPVGEREIGILRKAKSQGIAVPDVVDFKTIDGRAIAVLRFVDGMLLSSLLLSDSVAAAKVFPSVGKELARIHSIKFSVAGLFGTGGNIAQEFSDFCAGAKEYLLGPLNGLAGQRLGPMLTERVRRAVEQHWYRVYETYTAPTLVHCDFNPKNILVTTSSEPRVAAILDWEFSMAAHPIIDLGNFFRFEADYLSGARSAFIKGYLEGGGQLPEGWEKAARLFDLTNMSDFLSRPQEYPKTFRTARRVIESTLKEIERWENQC